MKSRNFRFALVFAITLLGFVYRSTAQDFKKQVIYQIVTDRFYDGDTTNDNPAESPGLFDSTHPNWFAYWGGDLAGIQQQMSYLKGMGVTAIWISPTVNNENLNLNSGTPISAPYHGYDGRDFMQVEEHSGDNSNSWTAFSNLTASAHANGIKVIVDWAENDTNYNQGGEFGSLYNNGVFMANDANDPNGYFHHNPAIGDFNDRYQLQYYTLENLEDLNQENPTIDSYLKTLGDFCTLVLSPQHIRHGEFHGFLALPGNENRRAVGRALEHLYRAQVLHSDRRKKLFSRAGPGITKAAKAIAAALGLENRLRNDEGELARIFEIGVMTNIGHQDRDVVFRPSELRFVAFVAEQAVIHPQRFG
jgi:hypothetical protein